MSGTPRPDQVEPKQPFSDAQTAALQAIVQAALANLNAPPAPAPAASVGVAGRRVGGAAAQRPDRPLPNRESDAERIPSAEQSEGEAEDGDIPGGRKKSINSPSLKKIPTTTTARSLRRKHAPVPGTLEKGTDSSPRGFWSPLASTPGFWSGFNARRSNTSASLVTGSQVPDVRPRRQYCTATPRTRQLSTTPYETDSSSFRAFGY